MRKSIKKYSQYRHKRTKNCCTKRKVNSKHPILQSNQEKKIEKKELKSKQWKHDNWTNIDYRLAFFRYRFSVSNGKSGAAAVIWYGWLAGCFLGGHNHSRWELTIFIIIAIFVFFVIIFTLFVGWVWGLFLKCVLSVLFTRNFIINWVKLNR